MQFILVCLWMNKADVLGEYKQFILVCLWMNKADVLGEYMQFILVCLWMNKADVLGEYKQFILVCLWMNIHCLDANSISSYCYWYLIPSLADSSHTSYYRIVSCHLHSYHDIGVRTPDNRSLVKQDTTTKGSYTHIRIPYIRNTVTKCSCERY